MDNVVDSKYKFDPDYVVPPGETLLETMEHLGMTHDVFAQLLGIPSETLQSIIEGVQPITGIIAVRLESVTNVPRKFWILLEKNYRKIINNVDVKEDLHSKDRVRYIDGGVTVDTVLPTPKTYAQLDYTRGERELSRIKKVRLLAEELELRKNIETRYKEIVWLYQDKNHLNQRWYEVILNTLFQNIADLEDQIRKLQENK